MNVQKVVKIQIDRRETKRSLFGLAVPALRSRTCNASRSLVTCFPAVTGQGDAINATALNHSGGNGSVKSVEAEAIDTVPVVEGSTVKVQSTTDSAGKREFINMEFKNMRK